MKFRTYLERLKNPASVMAITGFGIIVAQNMGLQFDSNTLNSSVQAICGICVVLGVMNNPDTKGLDLPSVKGSVE